MNFWVNFWMYLLILAIVLFAILSVVVSIGAFFDVKDLFKSIEAQHTDESQESNDSTAENA